MKRISFATLSLVIAALLYWPFLHCFYLPKDQQIKNNKQNLSPMAKALANSHLKIWTDSELLNKEHERMRRSNAEWDFMGRSFLVWALCNIALTEEDNKEPTLKVIDTIIDHTLKIEQEKGMYHFLMDYAKHNPFVIQPARSQFIDGEIALMLALRCYVEKNANYANRLNTRVLQMIKRMKQSDVLSSESYPDECWTFCNLIGLAAIKINAFIGGENNDAFIEKWLKIAKEKLVDQESGLLISSYTKDGRHLDGPEGSSIWLASHCLQILDPSFAKKQYWIAKKELSKSLLGFSYAREWPDSWKGNMDIDSGPIIPILNLSAGSSGLALIGASSFADDDYLKGLIATLNFAAFPSRDKEELKYCAGNQVGDSVLLYALVQGSIWRKINDQKN